MSKIQESDSENGEVESRLMEAKKPFLLHYNDEEILLNFIRNPSRYKEFFEKNETRDKELFKRNLKYQVNMLEKKKFNGSQKIFFWLLNFLTFTLAIILIAFSYQLESLSLGCGCLAFFFTLFNSIYDIMKRISGSLSKIIRNFLIFGGMLFFGILTLGGKEWPFKIELSQALFGISIGYFVGLILIKPMTTKAFK